MKTCKQFILDFFEDSKNNPKTEELIDKYVSDKDPELKGHILVFEAGIPGYYFVYEDIISEGNKVMVRGWIAGTHNGYLFGHEATGNPIKIGFIGLYEIENQKIVMHWTQADSVALMEQISKPVLVNS